MSGAAVLLPNNATPFERALATGFSDDLPTPLRDVVDPAAAPTAFLPFLAAHESVDLWFDDWAEARKRAMIAEAPVLAGKKGTRSGAVRFLTYVDATLVDGVAYPAPFVMGRSKIGRSPIGHPAYVARYLVKVDTFTPARGFVMGRAVLGRARLKPASTDKLDRCLVAIRAAKAPETEIRVDFAHHRPLALADAPPLDGTHRLGQYVARVKL